MSPGAAIAIGLLITHSKKNAQRFLHILLPEYDAFDTGLVSSPLSLDS